MRITLSEFKISDFNGPLFHISAEGDEGERAVQKEERIQEKDLAGNVGGGGTPLCSRGHKSHF